MATAKQLNLQAYIDIKVDNDGFVDIKTYGSINNEQYKEIKEYISLFVLKKEASQDE